MPRRPELQGANFTNISHAVKTLNVPTRTDLQSAEMCRSVGFEVSAKQSLHARTVKRTSK